MSVFGSLFGGEEEVHDLSSANSKIESLVLVKSAHRSLPNDQEHVQDQHPRPSPCRRDRLRIVRPTPRMATEWQKRRSMRYQISWLLSRGGCMTHPPGELAAAAPELTP